MLRNKLRIIIDSNLWISYFIKGGLKGFDDVLANDDIELLISEGLLQELSRVLRKPKLQKYLFGIELYAILRNIEDAGLMIDVADNIKICRDPKDDYLLALARDGEADYLITGDKDLLVLQQFEKTRIITLSDFVSQLG